MEHSFRDCFPRSGPGSPVGRQAGHRQSIWIVSGTSRRFPDRGGVHSAPQPFTRTLDESGPPGPVNMFCARNQSLYPPEKPFNWKTSAGKPMGNESEAVEAFPAGFGPPSPPLSFASPDDLSISRIQTRRGPFPQLPNRHTNGWSFKGFIRSLPACASRKSQSVRSGGQS